VPFVSLDSYRDPASIQTPMVAVSLYGVASVATRKPDGKVVTCVLKREEITSERCAEMIHRERWRERERKVCNDDERKEEKSIDHRVKEKKKSIQISTALFSASPLQTGERKEDALSIRARRR